MAVEFLPLMQELMASRFEDYIVVALEMSAVLLKGFSSLIKMTRATVGQVKRDPTHIHAPFQPLFATRHAMSV